MAQMVTLMRWSVLRMNNFTIKCLVRFTSQSSKLIKIMFVQTLYLSLKDYISFWVHLCDHERNGQTGKSMKRASSVDIDARECQAEESHVYLQWYGQT